MASGRKGKRKRDPSLRPIPQGTSDYYQQTHAAAASAQSGHGVNSSPPSQENQHQYTANPFHWAFSSPPEPPQKTALLNQTTATNRGNCARQSRQNGRIEPSNQAPPEGSVVQSQSDSRGGAGQSATARVGPPLPSIIPNSPAGFRQGVTDLCMKLTWACATAGLQVQINQAFTIHVMNACKIATSLNQVLPSSQQQQVATRTRAVPLQPTTSNASPHVAIAPTPNLAQAIAVREVSTQQAATVATPHVAITTLLFPNLVLEVEVVPPTQRNGTATVAIQPVVNILHDQNVGFKVVVAQSYSLPPRPTNRPLFPKIPAPVVVEQGLIKESVVEYNANGMTQEDVDKLQFFVDCSRGDTSNRFENNEMFRDIVSYFYQSYEIGTAKGSKENVARAVMLFIRYGYCGSFLRKGDEKEGENSELWYEIGDKEAIIKILSRFRDIRKKTK